MKAYQLKKISNQNIFLVNLDIRRLDPDVQSRDLIGDRRLIETGKFVFRDFVRNFGARATAIQRRFLKKKPEMSK